MDKIFGKNNPGLDKALLVNFNEARGKDWCRHFDAVKNLATQKSNVISNKYIADKTQPNYARLAFNSNNQSPIPPERRLVVLKLFAESETLSLFGAATRIVTCPNDAAVQLV